MLQFRFQVRRDPGHSPTLFSFLLLQASNGQWYQMNDSMVRCSNVKVVLNQEAYLLFYVRWECLQLSKPEHSIRSNTRS